MADGKPRIIANAADPQLNFVVCSTSSILSMWIPYVSSEEPMRIVSDSPEER